LLILLLVGSAGADDKPDLAVIYRIKEEAFQRGKVMDHLFAITDANGPRLTGSPGWKSAADWAVRALGQWGASNPHLESWGKFGRAWTVQRFELSLIAPTFMRLGGIPKAWSAPTNGAVTGNLILAPLFPEKEDRQESSDLAKLAARIHEYTRAHKGK